MSIKHLTKDQSMALAVAASVVGETAKKYNVSEEDYLILCKIFYRVTAKDFNDMTLEKLSEIVCAK